MGEKSSADVGAYKLWIYRILNGVNIDCEVDNPIYLLQDSLVVGGIYTQFCLF